MTMKRAVTFLLLGIGTAILGGCPIYPSDAGSRVCIGGECFACPDPYYSSACNAWVCTDGTDCPSGYACGSDRRCHLGDLPATDAGTTCAKPSDCPAGSNCGADNRCHAGDCGATGCPATYVCKVSGGVAQCVSTGTDAGDGGTGIVSSCKKDEDCSATTAGAKCLSGSCVAPQDQCADATQCTGGAQCVQGVCTPACDANKPCPTGYVCDTGKGVCTGNTHPCGATSECTNGTVCVEQHCVAPCGPGASCAAGLVCVDGGCTPNEKPAFVCTTEGVKSDCQDGSICLRHSCYIACDQDAGPDACKNADKFNLCKSVSTASGTYSVCGSNGNLGTECDPTQNKNCTAPAICIDGYCR